MRRDTSRGTFQDVIRDSPPEVRKLARRLRKIIAEVHPEVMEVPRPSEQHASYGIGLNKVGEIYGYVCPLKEYVRLGFYYGGALPNPSNLLEGSGKRLRHIKIYSIIEAERPAVRELLKAAVAERKQALGMRRQFDK